MSETELTKKIKELTHTYVPKIKSDMRTIRWADEVWTPTGIVDSIRFEDYYSNEEYICKLINSDRFKKNCITTPLHELGKCFHDGSTTYVQNADIKNVRKISQDAKEHNIKNNT